MKRLALLICVFASVLFCGCENNNPQTEIEIPESFECSVSIEYGEYSLKADMVRTMPRMYSFVLTDSDFDGAKISLKSDGFSFSFGDLTYESDKMSKASFLYGFTEVLDYISSCGSYGLEVSELRQDVILASGNDGYEDLNYHMI